MQQPRGILRARGVLALSMALVLATCGEPPTGQPPAEPMTPVPDTVPTPPVVLSRQLVDVAVQPVTAYAVAPTGTRQFSATGKFDEVPLTQENLTARWHSSNPETATLDSDSGLARCVGPEGVVQVSAAVSIPEGAASATATLACLTSEPSPLPPPWRHASHCQVGPGGVMNGYCLGIHNGICERAYDPTHCGPGEAPTRLTVFQCASSGPFVVDGTRTCTP